MAKINTIFLDLDDVLNQFVPHVMRHLGCEFESYADYPAGYGWNLVGVVNHLLGRERFTSDSLWRSIPRSLWASVPPSDLSYWLLDQAEALVGRENIRVLTAASTCPEARAGKQEWAYRFLPPWLHGRVSISSTKFDCAKPGALLIDDAEHNTKAFIEHGGDAWLVPRPWNRNAHHSPQGYLAEMFYQARLDRDYPWRDKAIDYATPRQYVDDKPTIVPRRVAASNSPNYFGNN
jgi:hypothetical protein